MKIRKIVETDRKRDRKCGRFSLFKLFGGFFEPQVFDIGETGHSHIFFEKAHELVLAEVADAGELLNAEILCVVMLNVVEHEF